VHIAIAFGLGPLVGAAQVVHLEHNQGWSNGSVRNAALDGRIRDAALQYRNYAPVPRVALFDIAYPRDCAELFALKGHAVMVVSAVAQDSSELPPARVYAVLGGSQRPLSQLAGVQSRVADTIISATFGGFRHDALYLLPIEASRASGDVLLDFASHRQGFRLTHLSGQVPSALQSCSAAPSEGQAPPPVAVWGLVMREYPDLARVLSPPH
jgi:hypothetical protein